METSSDILNFSLPFMTVIYYLTVLAGYACGPPGARSAAVIFQRTASVITLADEAPKKKKIDPYLGKTFDS